MTRLLLRGPGSASFLRLQSCGSPFEEKAGRSLRDGMMRQRRVLGRPVAERIHEVHAKIALSTSRDIPFNRLVLSQANVRRIKARVSIEELAEDIARRSSVRRQHS